MPKLIKDAKESILREAKRLLIENGFASLNMRTVASNAGIASGTLYNYFPSKDHIVVSVMLEDWNAALRQMEAEIPNATTAIEGLEIVFQKIQSFSETYRATWRSFRGEKDFPWIREKYHKALIDQLCEQLLPLGNRFGFLFDPTALPFLSEVLLTGAAHPQGQFSYLRPCLKRIVGEQ